MALDLWDCFWKEKILSYNRRNTVHKAQSIALANLKTVIEFANSIGSDEVANKHKFFLFCFGMCVCGEGGGAYI